MNRREIIAGLGSAVALSITAQAQQPAAPLIGWLSPQSADDDYKIVTVPFLQGLKEAGYVEGQNVAVEYRWAENQYDRLPALAADLVGRRVVVIVAAGIPATLAAKAATATIPIIFNIGSDPVALGLVASLNRPGVNLTGTTVLTGELGPKRVQLLRELIPNAAGLAFSWTRPFRLPLPSSLNFKWGRARWACNSLLRAPEPKVSSKRLLKLFRNGTWVRSWLATVLTLTGALNNLRR